MNVPITKIENVTCKVGDINIVNIYAMPEPEGTWVGGSVTISK